MKDVSEWGPTDWLVAAILGLVYAVVVAGAAVILSIIGNFVWQLFN